MNVFKSYATILTINRKLHVESSAEFSNMCLCDNVDGKFENGKYLVNI